MSDENVGGLVAKWRGMADENRRKPFRTASEVVMCDTLNDCADELEAALSAHGQPVVDDAAISRVMDAQPFADKNDARRVWQLFRDDVHVGDAIRGIAAALGDTP